MTSEESGDVSQQQWRESYDALCAVLDWMDEAEELGRKPLHPPRMKAELIKTAGRIQDQLDEIPFHLNHDVSDVLYEDDND